MVAVLEVAAVLYGVLLSPVPWGRRGARAPLGQELDCPREGSIVWGRVFHLLLELGACLSQTRERKTALHSCSPCKTAFLGCESAVQPELLSPVDGKSDVG